MRYSVSPSGEQFPLPDDAAFQSENQRLAELIPRKRREGHEIVVVMGVGFVGAVMAGVIADSVDRDTGRPGKFVIGMQRPSERSYWKIRLLDRGEAPVKAEDPEVEPLIRRCVQEKGTLIGTFTYEAMKYADVLVVDIQCDYHKNSLGNLRTGHVDMEALEQAFHIIGQHIPPSCLVLIETTVAPGTTELVALPILRREFRKRGIQDEPLLAHSFERVMPGRDYVSSIRDFWRVCAGVNDEARDRVVRFLSDVLNTEQFPLTVMDRPIESETCKIVENSYRATILAFLDEWSLFAERNGVDLKKVVEAVKVRPTHSNILFPGPGIGGYCLPKDGGLGMWAYTHLLGYRDDIFRITPAAIDINDTRALHVAELVRDALREAGQSVGGSRVLVMGASYREDVADTRYSGSEVIVRKLAEMGVDVSVHDPYVAHWFELENQATYPGEGRSLSRFFRDQERLSELRVHGDLAEALRGVDAVLLAVRHKPYQDLDPRAVVEMIGKPAVVVDCFCLLSDDQIRQYLRLGCEVKALGRGHISRLKAQVNGAAEANPR